MNSASKLWVPILLVSSVLALGLAPSAKSDTVYTFTGRPFTTFSGIIGIPGSDKFACPPICSLTGSFTIASPLGDNLALQAINHHTLASRMDFSESGIQIMDFLFQAST